MKSCKENKMQNNDFHHIKKIKIENYDKIFTELNY